MMLTRRMVLSFVALVAAAPAFAQDDEVVAFVRDFYTKEVARHAAKQNQSEDEFLRVFTKDAQELWRVAQQNRSKTNILLGPIRHLFLGTGVLPGREVKLGAVAASGGGAVSVALTVQGNPRQLVVRPRRAYSATAQEGLTV